MEIEIVKSGSHYRADCKDLPGMPPVGIGATPEMAVTCLFWCLMFEDPKTWLKYIKKDEPIVVNGVMGIVIDKTQIKQVLVIRKDLKMRRGKEIAQGSHASLAWLSDRIRRFNLNVILSEEEIGWINGNFAKVCLQVDSEEKLLDVYNKAKEKNLTAFLITDSGLTEFNGVPTNTCCGIGPHSAERFVGITDELKLY